MKGTDMNNGVDSFIKDEYYACIGEENGNEVTECIMHKHLCKSGAYLLTIAWPDDTESFYCRTKEALEARIERESDGFYDVRRFG